MNRLVLVGAGHAHLSMLLHLRHMRQRKQHPLIDFRISMVHNADEIVLPQLVPALLGEQLKLDQARVDLTALAHAAGVEFIQASVDQLRCASHTLILRNGAEHAFEHISINLDMPTANHCIEGANEHALFAHPAEHFLALWPRVLAMTHTKFVRIAIVGATIQSIEIALCIQEVLDQQKMTRMGHGGNVTLITGDRGLALDFPAAATALTKLLHNRGIAIVHDNAVKIGEGLIELSSGAAVATHAPIICAQRSPSTWIEASGLACDDNGCIKVDSTLRSISHPAVWAMGACALIQPLNQANESSNMHRVLIKNMVAVKTSQPLTHITTKSLRLRYIADGRGAAVMAIGSRMVLNNRWVWGARLSQLRRWVTQLNANLP